MFDLTRCLDLASIEIGSNWTLGLLRGSISEISGTRDLRRRPLVLFIALSLALLSQWAGLGTSNDIYWNMKALPGYWE